MNTNREGGCDRGHRPGHLTQGANEEALSWPACPAGDAEAGFDEPAEILKS